MCMAAENIACANTLRITCCALRDDFTGANPSFASSFHVPCKRTFVRENDLCGAIDDISEICEKRMLVVNDIKGISVRREILLSLVFP